MNKILSPKKLLLVLGFILSMQGFASFVDNGSTKKTNANTDISLKNFNKSNYKNTASKIDFTPVPSYLFDIPKSGHRVLH